MSTQEIGGGAWAVESTRQAEMTNAQRKQAAIAVAEWLTEYRGDAIASFWALERTPMPEGLRWALEGATNALASVSTTKER